MKKIITSILLMVVFIFIGFSILNDSTSILESVKFSVNIWQNNVFPSLFPFFVLSELLINYGFIELVSELFKPLMNLFKVKKEASFIFIMSIISGFPSNAKYVRELYNQKLIDENEAAKILMFTFFSNPLFILGTISIMFLDNKEAGLLILFCHYFTNIIIGIVFRNYYPSIKNDSKISIKKAILDMHNKRISNNKSFGEIITNSLMNSINTLLLILGVITLFLVLTTILNNNLQLKDFYTSILNGFIEMTQGLKYVSLLNISLKFKTIISTMIISFGGISVHMQIISILSDTKIKYLPFLLARILHTIISGLLVFILFDLIF